MYHSSCTLIITGVSQCIHEPLQEEVGSQGKQILWPQYGVEVNVPPTVLYHSYVGLKVYNGLATCFEYFHEYIPHSNVYELIISSRGEDPRGVTMTLSNFRPHSNFCLMAASRDPSKWTSDLAPVFSFSKVEGLESPLSTGKMEVSLEASGVYFVLAGRLAVVQCVVILSLCCSGYQPFSKHKLRPSLQCLVKPGMYSFILCNRCSFITTQGNLSIVMLIVSM